MDIEVKRIRENVQLFKGNQGKLFIIFQKLKLHFFSTVSSELDIVSDFFYLKHLLR